MATPNARAVQVTNKAISTAVEILKQCGWKYTLNSPDGQILTNTKPKAKRPKVHSFTHLNIGERFAIAIPGQPIVFSAGSIPLKNLRARITGEASRVFGSGNYFTQTDAAKKTVTVIVGVPAKALATEIAMCIDNVKPASGHTQPFLNS